MHEAQRRTCPLQRLLLSHRPAPSLRPPALPLQRYCGAQSWLIGLCLFPCICFCPVDQRPIYGVPGSIPLKPNGKPYRLK